MSYTDEVKAGLATLLESGRQTARVACESMFTEIVDISPVKTGLFASNWQTVEGASDLDLSGVSNRGRSATLSEMRTVIERWDCRRPLFLVNVLPYGPRLEYEGWSRQAPNGMVRITAVKWPRFLKDAASKVQGRAAQ